jgi:hypothetical protein
MMRLMQNVPFCPYNFFFSFSTSIPYVVFIELILGVHIDGETETMG